MTNNLLLKELSLPLADIEAGWRDPEKTITALAAAFNLTPARLRGLAGRAAWGPKAKPAPKLSPPKPPPGTKYCTRLACLQHGQPQPLEEFIDRRSGRIARACQRCRDFTNQSNRRARQKSADHPAPGGYDAPPPQRVFKLPTHHYILDIPPWHPLGKLSAALADEDAPLTLLRDPSGRPVARRHPDLKPGEVSLVLG